MKQLAVIFLLAALIFGATDASAHTRSESYSHWYLSESSITGVVTIPLREVMTRYQIDNASIPPSDLFKAHLLESTHVFSANKHCTRTSDQNIQTGTGFIRVELQFSCDTTPPERIQYRAMFDIAPAHVHYAKLHMGSDHLGETLITASADSWNIGQLGAEESWSFSSFVGIGVEHIAGGIDHIAFLFGLLLIAGSAGRCIIAVTGFTVGHSISLAAAVLGYVSADSQLVEAFIGFTVALVAVEFFSQGKTTIGTFAVSSALIAWLAGAAAFLLGFISGGAAVAYIGFGIFAASYLMLAKNSAESFYAHQSTALLLVATACFGLVHGFGFAGFLMETGLLGTDLFVPLLGFNIGVELGQLVIVAITMLGAKLLGDITPRVLPQLVAAGLCGLGVFWFIGRTLA